MFRFSIRDVLWLTVVVALAVAWWLQRQEARATFVANQELVAENKLLQARLVTAEWWAKKHHEYYRATPLLVGGGSEPADLGQSGADDANPVAEP